MSPRDVTTAGDLDGFAEAVDRLLASSGGRGGSDALDRLLALLGQVDRLQALGVDLVDEVLSSQVCAKVEGLDTEQVLRTSGGRTSRDARMLVSITETLRAMPGTARLLRDGTLSWAVVRAVAYEARRLSVAERGWLDRRITADIERLVALGADAVVDAVERAITELDARGLERRERRGHRGRFLTLAPFLDGSGGSLYGELDAEGLATVAEATEVASRRAGCEADQDAGASSRPSRRTLGRRRADGLVNLAGTYLAGGGADGPPKPRFVVLAHAEVLNALPAPGPSRSVSHDPTLPLDRSAEPEVAPGEVAPATDIAALTALLIDAGVDAAAVGSRPDAGEGAAFGGGAGLLLWRTPSGPVVLSRQTVDRLACDASYRVVLRDGARIIGVVSTKDLVDGDLRAALIARDGGCRFPGCRRAPAHCHAHHVVYRRHGGETAPPNLILLCDHHHRVVHDHRWKVAVHGDGSVDFRRGKRAFTTLPRRMRCLPPRAHPCGGSDPPRHDPPRHDPPCHDPPAGEDTRPLTGPDHGQELADPIASLEPTTGDDDGDVTEDADHNGGVQSAYEDDIPF